MRILRDKKGRGYVSNRYIALILGGLAGTMCLVPAHASDARLRAQVQALQAKVHRLERLLGACEARGPAPTQTPRKPAAGPQTHAPAAAPLGPPHRTRTDVWRHEWARLRHQMRAQQVRALLGAPSRIVQLGGERVWYYSYGSLGKGSVAFGSNHRVLAWQTPPFGSWF